MNALAPGQFYDPSQNPAVSAHNNGRIAEYNELYQKAEGALSDIYVAGQTNLTVGAIRLEQVAQVLQHLATHGQTAAAQDDFLQGKPLALGGSGTAPAVLGTSDSNFLDQVKAHFGGDLDKIWQFITGSAKALADAKTKSDELAEQLRKEKEEHAKSKKTVNATDPKVTQQITDLTAHKTRLERELAAEKAKKVPATPDVAEANAYLDDISSHCTQNNVTSRWSVNVKALKPETKTRIGVK